MLEPEKNQTHLIEVLERLCLVIEDLNENLRPELNKTATFERMKQDTKEIKTAAAEALSKWRAKIKTRPVQSSTDQARKRNSPQA